MNKINKHNHNHEECSCGCGCKHEHIHEASGHMHEHGHHHEECGCGHHHDHSHDHHKHTEIPENINRTIFILENLGCANCAAKMERKIQQLPEVKMATITYATKQLAIVADNPEKLIPEIQKICASIESEVRVVFRKESENKEALQKNTKDIVVIASGALLFVAGLVVSVPWLFVAAYVLLGIEIVVAAVKNLTKGHVFDEHFLMSIATIAALAIGDFAEAAGIMLFYRVGTLFEDAAVKKSRSQIMDAVDMRPEIVRLIHGENIEEVKAETVRPGEQILIRPGDRIPLDGKVLDGQSQIDTSPITGEAIPVSVYPGMEIYSGCMNLQGALKMTVTKPLEESMVSRILNSVENAAASKPKIDRFITKFARIYTPVVVMIAIATAVIPSLLTGNWEHWIYTAITFLVISCPCALVLSIPLTFFAGIGAGSRQGILFKGGIAMEALKNVKAVVMDKTGTITKGNFAVHEVQSYGMLTEKQILTIAADCEMVSAHPIGISIVEAAKEKNYRLIAPLKVIEVSGKGIKATFPEAEVLCGNKELLQENDVDICKWEQTSYGTEVLLAINGKLEGELIVRDVLKADSGKAILKMKNMNLVTAILTGDTEKSAQAVAKETGVSEVHAQLLPHEKLEHLREIRKKYGEVLFVGDGINDAPVLAGADVGAAMGSGADAAIEAADVVFMNSSLEAIPTAIQIARKTGRIAMQNVVFALLVKFLVMLLGFAGFANMWMAVFADTGVAMLCVINAIRVLYN